MKFASVRLVTHDLDALIAFYTMLTGLPAVRPNPDFAEIRMEGATLALTTEKLIKQFNAGAATAAANRSAILEFQVDDVDALRARLGNSPAVVMEPVTQPWGNRSMLLRDPDGTVVNVFAPPRQAAQPS